MRKSYLVTVVAVGSIAGAVAVAWRPAHPRTLRPETAAAASVQVHALPSYVPPGAALTRDAREEAIGGWLVEYSLPGEANRSTIDATTFAAGAGHPATVLRLAIVSSIEQFPPLDTTYFETTHLSIGDHPGALTTPRSGYGPHTVVWSDGSNAYRLSEDRLWTPAGKSGVALEELLRVAASIA